MDESMMRLASQSSLDVFSCDHNIVTNLGHFFRIFFSLHTMMLSGILKWIVSLCSPYGVRLVSVEKSQKKRFSPKPLFSVSKWFPNRHLCSQFATFCWKNVTIICRRQWKVARFPKSFHPYHNPAEFCNFFLRSLWPFMLRSLKKVARTKSRKKRHYKNLKFIFPSGIFWTKILG